METCLVKLSDRSTGLGVGGVGSDQGHRCAVQDKEPDYSGLARIDS
jgi:hypothetical protein